MDADSRSASTQSDPTERVLEVLREHELPGRPGRQRGRALRRHHHRAGPDPLGRERGPAPAALLPAVRRLRVRRALQPLRGAPAQGGRRDRGGPDDRRTRSRSSPDAPVAEAAQLIARAQAQPAPGDRARAARRRRDPPRRARGAHAGVADAARRWPGSTWARSSATRRGSPRSPRPAALCAVVKADGYGHGMVPAARAAQAGGASWLAVATAEEARGLRAAGLEGRCW